MKLISRDIFYFVLLIMLVKVAVSNRQNAPEASFEPDNLHTVVVNTHEELPRDNAAQSPIATQEPCPAPVAAMQPALSSPTVCPAAAPTRLAAYNFAELEANLLAQIDAAQKQVDALIPQVSAASEHAAHLHSLKQKLAHLRHAYQQSLAAPLFGLQSATSSDSSTQALLEKDLLRVINKLGLIAHSIQSNQANFTPAESVVKGLEANHGLLEKVIL